jgi:hypothetical protein
MLDAFMFHMTGDGAIALCLAGVVLSVVSFRLLPRRAAGRRLAMLALVVCLPIPMITALLLAFLLVMALPSLF